MINEPVRLEILFSSQNKAVVSEVNRSLSETQARLEKLASTSRQSTTAMRAFNSEVNRLAAAQHASISNGLSRMELGFTRVTRAAATFARVSFYAVIGQVAAATYAVKKLGDEFIKVNQQFASLEITMRSSFGSVAAARGIRSELVKITAQTPIPFQGLAELLRSASVIPYTRSELLRQSSSSKGYSDPNGMLKRLVGVAEKMITFRPDKSIQDAIFSLREALSGQFRSIIRRFDVPASSFSAAIGRPMSELKADPELTFKAIEKFFGSVITPQAVAEMVRQPKLLFQNLIEQILDIPLLRVGDQGIYDKFLSRFTDLYDEATRFMESGSFNPYAKRISNALSKAVSDAFGANGGFFDRLLHMAGQGAGDRPGISLVERSYGAITKGIEYVSQKLPGAIDRVSHVFVNLLPVMEKVASGVLKLADIFSGLLASHPIATVGTGIAAYTGLPVLQSVLASMIKRRYATASASAAVSGLSAVEPGLASIAGGSAASKLWSDYGGSAYSGMDSDLLAAAPFLAQYSNKKKGYYLRSNYEGFFSAQGKPHYATTPVSPALAYQIRDEEAKFNLAKSLRQAEYERELLANGGFATAGMIGSVGRSTGLLSSLRGAGSGIASKLGALGAGAGAVAMSGIEVFGPLIAAVATIYGAAKLYEVASNKIDQAADKMLGAVKTSGFSKANADLISQQFHEDYSRYSNALVDERAQRAVHGDFSFKGLPNVSAPYLVPEKYTTSTTVDLGGYVPGGKTYTTEGIRAGVKKISLSFDELQKDTTKLASFYDRFQHLFSNPESDPNHIRSIPAGAYSNQFYQSPELSISNLSEAKRLMEATKSILQQRYSSRPAYLAKLDSAFKYSDKPSNPAALPEKVQSIISEASVAHGDYTDPSKLFATPELVKLYSNLPDKMRSAESSSYALQNYMSDMGAKLEKLSPEASLTEQVTQLKDWNEKISTLNKTVDSLGSSQMSPDVRKSLSEKLQGYVNATKKRILDYFSGDTASAQPSIDKYMQVEGNRLTQISKDAVSGKLEEGIRKQARDVVTSTSNDMFMGYVAVLSDELTRLVGSANGGLSLSDFLTNRKAQVSKFLGNLKSATGGKFGDPTKLMPLIESMMTDSSLVGEAATRNLNTAVSRRSAVSGILAPAINQKVVGAQADYYAEYAKSIGLITNQGASFDDSKLGILADNLDKMQNLNRNYALSATEAAAATAKFSDELAKQAGQTKLSQYANAQNLLVNPGVFGEAGMGAPLTNSTIGNLKDSFGVLYPELKLSNTELSKFDVLYKDSTDPQDIGNLVDKYKTLGPVLSDIADKMQAYVDQTEKASQLHPGDSTLANLYNQAYAKYTPLISQYQGMSNSYGSKLSDIQGDGLFTSLKDGFTGITENWKATGENMKQVGQGIAQSISSNFGQAWANFSNGSEKAGLAFKQFATNVLQSIAQIMAQKAFETLFGMFVGSFASSAAGGVVSAGSNASAYAHTAAGGGLVVGGSGHRDDIPVMLMGGEGILNQRAMKLVGKSGLDALNSGKIGMYASGGTVGPVPDLPVVTGSNSVSKGNVNVSININNHNTGSTSNTNVDANSRDRMTVDFARQIDSAVMTVINRERRPGGTLRGI